MEIINLKKTKNLPKKGLKERTLWVVVKKLGEKMQNEGRAYTDLLRSIQEDSYGDDWRSCIFSLAVETVGDELTQSGQKLRNKMIKKEVKVKKYLWKNDFDPMKGFLEFFDELTNDRRNTLFKRFLLMIEAAFQEFPERPNQDFDDIGINLS